MNKDMKIRVDDKNRQEVKKALLGMGYVLCDDESYWHDYDTTSAFVVRKGLDTLCRIDDDDEVNSFELCSATEHWFVNGQFVDASYWTQPATVIKAAEETFNNPHSLYAERNLNQYFQSRTVHNKARMLALAEQISHLLRTEQEVPVEYALELYELANTVEHYSEDKI